MNLEQIRSLLEDERDREELIELEDSFYSDVGAHLYDLRVERSKAADEAQDPFNSEEVKQLTERIQSIVSVTEALFEVRVGKLLLLGNRAAKGETVSQDSMSQKERDLFEDIVIEIEAYRNETLDEIIRNK